MRNLKLLLEYDGTNYVGWQRQENGTSVQGALEAAVAAITQQEASVIGAGRTDAGVHARGQVANFRSTTLLSADQLRGGLNALLPEDIAVTDVSDVPETFHARFSAIERRYSYLITLRPSALLRFYAWHVKYELDLREMERAATFILGTHDFQSYCKANSDVEHHRCDIRSASWASQGETIRFSIAADRFLHGMVRALVGTMVDIGRGFLTLEEFATILERRDRAEAGMAAPARGLVLEQVLY
jgi:tRNA pseudouridine38-40 synthase